ncbi:MAG: NUDIX domain-containing protein [Ignavibacteria bacterium]|nr:NUDIX domain-containing protein [Ignavibacteria bacterium]
MILATLLYIKNNRGEYLLINRSKEPNKGLLSPPGGKVNLQEGESIFKCCIREALEECGIKTKAKDWKLLGIVTEKNYPKIGNIMIFCMEYKKLVNKLPKEMNEGNFVFIAPEKLHKYKLPKTDKLYIWKFVLKKKWFSLRIDCTNFNKLKCEIENG